MFGATKDAGRNFSEELVPPGRTINEPHPQSRFLVPFKGSSHPQCYMGITLWDVVQVQM